MFIKPPEFRPKEVSCIQSLNSIHFTFYKIILFCFSKLILCEPGLTPSVKKFSRRLVKGVHFLDHVSDVLNEVTKEQGPIELQ